MTENKNPTPPTPPRDSGGKRDYGIPIKTR